MTMDCFRPTAVWQPSPQEVAEFLGGELFDVENAPARLTGLGTLAEAGGNEISFVASEKVIKQAESSAAGLLLVSPRSDMPGRARVVVPQVWVALADLMRHMFPEPAPAAEVHPTAVVGRNVRLGAGVSVGAYCVIGDNVQLDAGAILGPHCIVADGCRVGAGSRLVARVTLVGNVYVGQRVVLHPGVVIGAEGFKFEVVAGQIVKIPQVGAVVIEDEVEIGANTTIDRAFLYETRIGYQTKIDNQVQIGHNVQIGPQCLIVSKVGISGSTRLGRGCMLGGAAGLSDGLTIGDGVIIGAGSGVHSDWPAGSMIQGAPAMPMKEFWRVAASMGRLPELLKRVRELERKQETASGQNA